MSRDAGSDRGQQDSMRAFVAISLPTAVQQAVATLQQQLSQQLQRPSVWRWTPPENMHVTLRFLGETDERQAAKIAQGLAALALAHRRFALTLQGLGVFPHRAAPRVLWAGLQGDLSALTRLQLDVEQLAQTAGFAAESRPFSPHLTLARPLHNAALARLAQDGQTIAPLAAQEIPASTFTVSELLFMRSERRREGARYTAMATAPLPTQEG